MNSEYWAIACRMKDLETRIDDYFEQLYGLGHTRKIQLSHYYYFGKGNKSAYLHRSGSQGQITDIVINNYHSLVQHAVTLVTANRPAFDARATNTDYTSQVQAMLGEQIVDYYLREKKVEGKLHIACDYALKYSEGFIGQAWDTSLGKPFSTNEDGSLVNDGDIRFTIYNPLQAIRDVYNTEEHDWVILSAKQSRYSIAAQYPEAAEHILNIQQDHSQSSRRDVDYLIRQHDADKTDMIDIYTFMHKKSTVLPEGKLVIFVKGKKLLETVLPYDEIPLHRIAPGNLDGTCLGYSGFWDILGIQEATDALYSSVVSNNLTFGKQFVQTKPDSNVNVSQITDGLSLVESENPLEPVNLTKSAPETYQLIDKLESKQQENTGMNEVVRGVPSPNLRSGNSMALIAAQAITYNSGIQSSYNMLIEDVGTGTIRILKAYAKSPRFASIVGKYKKAFMKEFQGSDLEYVDRITVEQQGSVMRTTAGKVDLAESLLQNGLIKRPEQYLMVLETGRLDPLIESEQAELLLIRQENEMLAEGNRPISTPLDDHALHIREHKAVLSTPDARQVGAVVSAVLEHIQEHIDHRKNTDPELLMLIGVQPSQMQEQGGGQGAPVEEMAPPEAEAPGRMPSQPKLPEPTDPQTEQAYEQLQELNGGE